MNYGARHQRKANNMGYVRTCHRRDGELCYEARLATAYLGRFDTRAAAEAAIERARRRQATTTTAPEGSAA